MDTVFVVCAAGASSTFLASRLRSLAASRAYELTAVAVGESELAARLDSADLVLVGPHLANRFEILRAYAAERGVTAVLLPDTAFGPHGADQAFALSLLHLRRVSQPSTQGLNNA